MLAARRSWCTRLALGLISLALLEALVALAHPFPLIADGHGGYSNAPNFWTTVTALSTSGLAGLFSIFAGKWRGRLIVASVSMCLLSYLALFTDGH
jgi:hypothetical protein